MNKGIRIWKKAIKIIPGEMDFYPKGLTDIYPIFGPHILLNQKV